MAAGNGHGQGINGVIISSDSHVMEPVDLWKKGVPEKYREAAPSSLRTKWAKDSSTTPAVGIRAPESRRWKPMG